MGAGNSATSPAAVAEVLTSIQKKGVRLWSQNGQLHYRMPAGALTPEELASIRAAKEAIVSILERRRAGELSAAEPTGLHRGPLAYSQLVHLQLYRLNGPEYRERSMRTVAGAMRLRGRFHLAAFRASVAEMVRRHPALRTRIFAADGELTQTVTAAQESNFDVDVRDLTGVPSSHREQDARRHIEELILQPIDLARDPLVGLRLLRISELEHVLIVAMEHLVSDGTSLNILLRDLISTYIQQVRGESRPLPPVAMQYLDYATWQAALQQSSSRERLERAARLSDSSRLRFPEEERARLAHLSGWKCITFRLDKTLKTQLLQWCRRARTTLVMAIYAMYSALVLRWCDASEGVIQYQTNGRIKPDIEHTVGYFASVLYPYITLRENDNFLDLAERVSTAYCEAYEHADLFRLAAQDPPPEFTRNTVFNWSPRGSDLDLSALAGTQDALECTSIDFEHPILRRLAMDHEPEIQFRDSGSEILATVQFAADQLSVATMERFVRNFMMFVKAAMQDPQRRIRDVRFVP